MQDLTRIWHIVTTRRTSREVARDPSRARRTGLAGVALVSTLALSGCGGIYFENTKPVLPTLSVDEQMFQDTVRQDLLIEQSARDLAQETIDDCNSCSDVLTAIADHSIERSQVLGGLWEPWPAGPPSDAPTLPALPEPYPDAHIVARRAVESGITVLHSIDTLDDMDDRIAVSAVALGRIADGLRLADALGISGSEVDTWVSPAFGLADATPSSLTDEAKSDLATAIAGWDCATQLIPLYTAGPDSADGPSWTEYHGQEQTEKLLTLTANLLALDVPDERIPSCIGAFEHDLKDADVASPVDEIEQRLLSVSLTLFIKHPNLVLPLAQEESVRPLGFAQLIETLRYWNQLGAVPAVPGITITSDDSSDTAVEDAETGTPGDSDGR